MFFHMFSQLRRILLLPERGPTFLRSRARTRTAGRSHFMHVSHKLVLVGLLLVLYGWLPNPLFAQNSVIQPVVDSPFRGNYCTVTGGLSLEAPPHTGTFGVDVPGTPVAAYWFWAGRSHSQPHVGDDTIAVDHNGAGATALVAQQAYSSEEPTFTWFTYAWEDEELALVQTGSNSYSISDFIINGNYDENHGVSLVVVYADPSCPYSEIFVHHGLDSYRHTRPEGEFGPTSEVLCLPFAPSNTQRSMDFEVFVGGVMNETRNHAIWYDTGVGVTPGNLVNESFATEIPDPLNNIPGPQWDMYSDQFDVYSGDEYACLQLESRKDDNGDSAVWVALVAQIELHMGSIGDTVWYDDNGDGVFDSNESGMDGVTVVLYDDRGTELQRMVTDANGFYTFANLPEGRYTVAVDPLTLDAELDTQTYELDGTLDGNTAVALTRGQMRDDVDFGYQRLGSIGDRVWHDLNGNGLQDADEPGMDGITVQLRQNGTVLNTTQTAPNGSYGFDGLLAGTYRVEFVAPEGYQTSPQNAGADDVDSDADPATGLSDLVTLTPGMDVNTVDAGFYKLIDLSLTKTSENDVVEAGSQNMFTVRVTNSGPSIATGVTVADQLPEGLAFLSAMASQGSYDAASGVWNVGTLQVGQSATLTLVTLVTETGLYSNSAQVSLANELDADSTPGNNDPNEDDQDSADVEATPDDDSGDGDEVDLELLKLASPSFLLVGEETTFMIEVINRGPDAATGVVVEDPLPAGLAVVSVSASQGTYAADTGIWEVGTVPMGQNAVLTIIATVTQEGVFVNTAEIILTNEPDKDSTPGNDDPTEDDQSSATVGTIELGSLGDRVWLDENANGVQDAGEKGYPGIFVTLYGADGAPMDAARTDDAGIYAFTELRPGIYAIGFSLPQGAFAFSPQNAGDDDAVDSDVDRSTNRTPMIQVDSGESDTTWDAGIYPLPLLSVTKTDHDLQAQPGGDIAYTLVYTNAGPGDAYNVVITEQVPQYTTFNPAASSPGWQCENGSVAAGTLCHYAVGTVPAGTSGSLEHSFVVTVDSPLPPEIEAIYNTVFITHEDRENDPPGGQDEAVEETPLTPTGLYEGEEPGAPVRLFLPVVTKQNE